MYSRVLFMLASDSPQPICFVLSASMTLLISTKLFPENNGSLTTAVEATNFSSIVCFSALTASSLTCPSSICSMLKERLGLCLLFWA